MDLVALANNQNLDHVLSEIFNHKDTIVIGFSFGSDMQVFSKCLPRMSFFKSFSNFIDLQTYYSKVCLQAQCGLAKVAESILKKPICKGE